MSYLGTKIKEFNPGFDETEEQVNKLISPIPRDYTTDGIPLPEDHPSCGYRIMPDGVAVVKDLTDNAGVGYNEITLIKKLEELDLRRAFWVQNNYAKADVMKKDKTLDWDHSSSEWLKSEDAQKVKEKYGFTEKVMSQLKMNGDELNTFILPVINNGEILQIGYYHPNNASGGKWHYEAGVRGSLIVAYDQWIYDRRPTLICEGQKDMMIARSLGYNAICFTNGAKSLPELYHKYFKGRDCNIVYDNDAAGRDGARKLAVWLREVGAGQIKVVEGHHKYLEEKGDIWDFFKTINRTKSDLDKIIEETPMWTKADYQTEVLKQFPLTDLKTALSRDNLGKVLQSDVIIRSEYTTAYVVPELAKVHGILKVGKEVFEETGMFSAEYVKDLIPLTQPKPIQKSRVYEMAKDEEDKPLEGRITSWQVQSRVALYSFDVTPSINDWEKVEGSTTTVIQAFSMEKKPEVGKQYRIKYRIQAHPDLKSTMIMCVEDFIPIEDFTMNFQLTKEMKEALKVFQPKAGQTVKDKMNEFYNDMKGYAGKKLEWEVWAGTEICYNSVYQFNWMGRPARGTVDCAIVGDAGIGKSWLQDKLQRLYRQGRKISSENATMHSIIGGSSGSSSSGYKTTIGELGQNDKKLVCFEEYTLMKDEVYPYLNDARSSGVVSIHRVDNSITYSARLRMLVISNQREAVQQMGFNNNGLIPLKTLFPKPEQRRRFDYIVVTGSKKAFDDVDDIDFGMFSFKPTLPYDEELYRQRILWGWSRKPEQIIINESGLAIAAQRYAKEWWTKYWTKESLFGVSPEDTLQKIVRIACSCAVMTYSTTDGVNLLVTAEHIKWAYETFWLGIYDNKLFKIKDLVSQIALTSRTTPESINELQNLWNAHAVFINELAKMTDPVGKGVLESVSGMDKDTLNTILKEMLRWGFLVIEKEKYLPTVKFKGSYSEINKEIINKDLKSEALKTELKEETSYDEWN